MRRLSFMRDSVGRFPVILEKRGHFSLIATLQNARSQAPALFVRTSLDPHGASSYQTLAHARQAGMGPLRSQKDVVDK